jgi:peptidyl-prolyl cis-trans isomerase B (cyclophilin B)
MEFFVATFKMDKGDIVFRLYDETPIHTGRFIRNANEGFFKGISFYRLVPNFVVQTSPLEIGDNDHPYMWDEVKPPRRLKDNNFHAYGVLSACNTGEEHTSMGAFFIVLNRTSTAHLDKTQTTFGTVIKGIELIDQIEKDDIIHDIIISKWSVKT